MRRISSNIHGPKGEAKKRRIPIYSTGCAVIQTPMFHKNSAVADMAAQRCTTHFADMVQCWPHFCFWLLECLFLMYSEGEWVAAGADWTGSTINYIVTQSLWAPFLWKLVLCSRVQKYHQNGQGHWLIFVPIESLRALISPKLTYPQFFTTPIMQPLSTFNWKDNDVSTVNKQPSLFY